MIFGPVAYGGTEKDITEAIRMESEKVVNKLNGMIRDSDYERAKDYAQTVYVALQYKSPSLAQKWKDRVSGVFQRLKDTVPAMEENRKR